MKSFLFFYMKRKLLLTFCILITTTALSAQSGRITPPTPTPTPLAESPKADETGQEFPPCETALDEYVYISPRKIMNFAYELNRYGSCGYRIEKSNKIPLSRLETTETNTAFFAVMKLDAPNKYQYRLFPAYHPQEAQSKMNNQAAAGFYFKASHPFQIIAENKDGDWADLATNEMRSTYGTVLIFEKKAGETIRREYRVLNTDAIGKKVREQYQTDLNTTAAKGFRPVGVIKEGARFALVMEEDKSLSSSEEYLILIFNLGIDKKLTELNQSGYQPVFITTHMALLHRGNNPSSKDLTFRSFSEPEKILETKSELLNSYLLTSGLFYIEDDLNNKLFFVSDKNEATNKYEYKLYKMTDVAGRPKLTDKYEALRQPPTQDILNGFQNILKEGYRIREVLSHKEVYVLFERRN